MEEMREPKLVPPDYRMKVQAPDGMLRAEVMHQFQEMVNHLAQKGCTFFQVDENDERSVAIVSGWLKQPRMPDMPYVDRSDL
jgi:hypothetical protein